MMGLLRKKLVIMMKLKKIIKNNNEIIMMERGVENFYSPWQENKELCGREKKEMAVCDRKKSKKKNKEKKLKKDC